MIPTQTDTQAQQTHQSYFADAADCTTSSGECIIKSYLMNIIVRERTNGTLLLCSAPLLIHEYKLLQCGTINTTLYVEYVLMTKKGVDSPISRTTTAAASSAFLLSAEYTVLLRSAVRGLRTAYRWNTCIACMLLLLMIYIKNTR